MPADRGSRRDLAPGLSFGKLRDTRPEQLLIRFVLGATVSVAAGIVGKQIGARFSGVFLAFPAILPASLTLIQEKEGTRRADRNAIGAVLGGVALVVFGGIGEAAFGHLHAPVAMLAMLCGWLTTSLALYGVLAFLRPNDCDRAQD